jgi:hypothetical protein
MIQWINEKIYYLMKKSALLYFFVISLSHSQDTITFPWPVTPFNSTQVITGTFCEFRNTLSSNHFHNGTDIPKADGSPVYASLSGTVHSIGTTAASGTSAFVRVKTFIAGQWKHISYVHIEPNPALSAGSPVTAGVTVLGNILSGLGHVHFTERQLVTSENSTGVEIGSLRQPGGLEPYIDTYSPKILWVKFYQDNSNVEFTNQKIYGNVDFISHMVERNSTGNPNSSSTTNNGVYHTGYKIYSSDKSAVVYTPPSAGTRYKFDYKPLDAYSNNVYTLQSDVSNHIYILTNGTGGHGISTSTSNRTVNNNYFTSTTVPEGQYQLMVYALDTHGNADTVFVPFEVSAQDVIAPAPPKLRSILNDSANRVTVSWYPNNESDLLGYRLYSSLNGTTWTLQRNEIQLGRSSTSAVFTGISTTTPVFFRMTAVDSAAITNISEFSDTYGLRPNAPGSRVLVIDAFDRTSGSYKKNQHDFAAVAGQSINARYETAHNSAVVDGSVQLNNYHSVVWMFGDESSTDETFGTQEQAIAKTYLRNGGRIFANGSEIAFDLDRTSGPSVDARDFFNNFLKADYAGDASGSYTINGAAGTFMSGISFAYGDTLQGSPYREDYPDYVTPFGGSETVAQYANGLNAATAFTGLFPSGSAPGSVVYMGIPFETIHAKANRDAVMASVLNYFGVVTSAIDRHETETPADFTLEQNFPNPFNPTTNFRFSIAERGVFSLKIYDLLGKEIAVVVNDRLEPGRYTVRWNASGFSSGMYFYRLEGNNSSLTKRFVLTK